MYQRNVMPMLGQMPEMAPLPMQRGAAMPPMTSLPMIPQGQGDMASIMPLLMMMGGGRGGVLKGMFPGGRPPGEGAAGRDDLGALGLQPDFLMKLLGG